MAVDPGDDTDLENPQSWNAYAYARNNPVAYADRTGEFVVFMPTQGIERVEGLAEEMGNLSPTFNDELLAHGPYGPDAVISTGRLGPGHLGSAGGYTSPDYTRTDITVDLNQNGGDKDVMRTLAEEFGHANDYRTNTATVNKEQAHGTEKGQRGTERRAKKWANKVMHEIDRAKALRRQQQKKTEWQNGSGHLGTGLYTGGPQTPGQQATILIDGVDVSYVK